MDQEKFGKLIKDIRKKYNLTQKDLADKYNVTYQAVSKWENGINLPDISLIKKICEDYNIDINSVLDVKNKKNNKHLLYIIIILIIILGAIILIVKLNSNNDFKFKTLSTSCSNFRITGSISYNNIKSAIYISNIDYCGGDDTETYKEITCTLYEKNNDTTKVISSCKSDKSIKLEDYLKNVNISVDNYVKDCKEYSENSLYLEINATSKNDKTTNYKIPVNLNDSCKKD